jgi:Mg2+ and Co2+ transporter CorA
MELKRIGNLPRNLASPLDEMVFYWTKCKNAALLKETLKAPVNSAYYLLKFVAYAWNNQLEFIGCSVANSEWFADDHEAQVVDKHGWKDELVAVAEATKDIQFMRRKMGHFESAMTLSLERLGVPPVDSSPPVDSARPQRPLPIALAEAQRDFLSMSQRLQPFRQRVDDLSSIATEVAGLQVAFKSIRDSEQGLWLSVFAALVFPATFVASIFSMSDSYLPGASQHWVFWVTSVPLAVVVSLALMYGRGSGERMRQAWQRLPRGRGRRKGKDAEKA